MIAGSAAVYADAHDDFHHLGEINKASLVMLAEERIIPADLAGLIAGGIAKVIKEQAREGSARSANYLDFEARADRGHRSRSLAPAYGPQSPGHRLDISSHGFAGRFAGII